MSGIKVLAFDLGASSGRAILGEYDGKLTMSEIYRFENHPIKSDKLRWDFDRLLSCVKQGVAMAGAVDGIAFDAWGVDYGLIKENRLMANPVCYRQERTSALKETLAVMSESELYKKTGTQILPINTLVQLVAQKEEVEKADKLLFMPDLFAHAFCGSYVTDCTMASTSQLFDFESRDFNSSLINKFGLKKSVFPSVVKSGTIIGENGKMKVVTAGHDTQCATVAMKLNNNGAFLSCGTWSLFGTVTDKPIMTDESRLLGLSNEMGADGKINYLKNIVGLWIIQECCRNFKKDAASLAALAQKAVPFRSFIDPDDEAFAYPCDMPQQIRNYCQKTGQPVPDSEGEICRCVYESLALKYRLALRSIEKLTGRKDFLVIAGGGAKSELLCQMTANACSIPVTIGPIEAAASGNILLQLSALTDISIEEGVKLINYEKKTYVPTHSDQWDEAYDKFNAIISCHRAKE